MMRGIITLFFCLGVSYVFGQANGDYRTKASGLWSPSPADLVWETFNAGSWGPAATAPVSTAAGNITITAGHTITMNVNSTNDQAIVINGSLIIQNPRIWTLSNIAGTAVTVAAGATLDVNAGASLVRNGVATITVNGTLIHSGNFANTTPARLNFNASSVYEFAASSLASVPLATWNTASTTRITGVTIFAPGNLDQTFGNVVWDTPNMAGDIFLSGGLTTVRGNLTFTETGGSSVVLSDGGTYLLNVGFPSAGNLTIGTNADVIFSDGADVTANINGDFINSSPGLVASSINGGNVDIDIAGDLLLNAASTFNVSAGTGQTAINIAGDYTKTGALVSTGGQPLQMVFDGSGAQNFTSTTVPNFPINYSTSGTSNLIVAATSHLSGPGSLTIAPSTSLTVTNTSTNGAIRASTTLGNVRVAGTRTYNGTIIYGGAARQYMYSDTPNVSTTINNAANVDLRQNVTFTNGTLTLQTGLLRIANNTTLTVEGLAYGAATAAFGYNNGSNLILNGTGSVNLRLTRFGGTGMNNLTINRAGTVTQTTASLRINGTLALTNGTLAMGNNTLMAYGPITAAVGGALSATASGRLYVRGAGAMPATVPLSGALNILEMARPNETFTTTGALNITRLNLYAGSVAATAGAQMANNGTIYRTDGFLTAAIGAAGVYNVQYLAFTLPSITTGFEIPASGTALSAVTINNTAGTTRIVVMDKAMVAAAGIRVQRGVLQTNNFNVTSGGNFRVDATGGLLPGNSTFTFNGAANQSYTSLAGTYTFLDLVVNKTGGTFTLASALNIRQSFAVNSITTATVGTNRLTLLSDKDMTAYVPAMPGTAANNRGRINGTVIVQRYLPNTNSSRQYRYLSAPTTNTMVSDWQNEIPISGTFSNPSTGTFDGVVIQSTKPSMWTYNNLTAQYVAYPSSGSSTVAPVVNGVGYSVYGRTHTVTPLTLDSHGTLGQWDVNVAVTYTGAMGVNAGYNLVGNPYPAPVDWDLVFPASLRIGSTIYLTDNNHNATTSGLIAYSAGSGVSVPAGFDGTISQGQGFWVTANNAAQAKSVRFRENQKVAGQSKFIRKGDPDNLLRLAMTTGAVTDHLAVILMDSATGSYDYKYDGKKFIAAAGVNIASLSSDNERMVINAISRQGCDRAVPIDIASGVTGNYTFNFTGLESFDADITPTLYDKVENKTIDLATTPTYTFNVTNVATLKGRFELRFSAPALNTQLQVKGETACVGNSAAVVTLVTSQEGVQYTAMFNNTPVSAAITGNGGQIQIPVTLSGAQDAAEISISAQRATCTAQTLDQKATITLLSKPVVNNVTAGQVCGTGTASLTASATGGTVYNWYEGVNDVAPIEGQHGQTFTTPTLNKTKTYFVSAVNAAGCEGERVEVKANVLELTPAAIATDGYTLTSNYEKGNQWYVDGTLIAGATGKSIEASASGVYTLVVNTGACTSTSEGREMVILGTESHDNFVRIYPNPTPDKVFVEVREKGEVAVELISTTGVQLRAAQLSGNDDLKTATFDITSLPDGMYLVRVKAEAKTYTKKILKAK